MQIRRSFIEKAREYSGTGDINEELKCYLHTQKILISIILN